MVTRRTGLREQKKQATRQALREAALRLALERGPANVRVDDIAEAAGVSLRTYNNYYSSREQAIVAAVTAEREARVASAVSARAADVPLADAVIDAVIEQYADPGEHHRDALLLITTSATLREAFLSATDAIGQPLAAAIADRIDDGDGDEDTASVLAASVGAAVRVALQRWLEPATGSTGTGNLVVVSASLPDRLRAALEPLRPAFAAAERRPEQRRRR